MFLESFQQILMFLFTLDAGFADLQLGMHEGKGAFHDGKLLGIDGLDNLDEHAVVFLLFVGSDILFVLLKHLMSLFIVAD